MAHGSMAHKKQSQRKPVFVPSIKPYINLRRACFDDAVMLQICSGWLVAVPYTVAQILHTLAGTFRSIWNS